jgi:nitrogen regulatory protein P-II 1
MQKIEAVVRRSQAVAMRQVFARHGVTGILISAVIAAAAAATRPSFYRGAPYAPDVPLAKVEAIVPDEDVERLAEAIATEALTLGIDDGRLTFTPVTTMVAFGVPSSPTERRRAIHAVTRRS